MSFSKSIGHFGAKGTISASNDSTSPNRSHANATVNATVNSAGDRKRYSHRPSASVSTIDRTAASTTTSPSRIPTLQKHNELLPQRLSTSTTPTTKTTTKHGLITVARQSTMTTNRTKTNDDDLAKNQAKNGLKGMHIRSVSTLSRPQKPINESPTYLKRSSVAGGGGTKIVQPKTFTTKRQISIMKQQQNHQHDQTKIHDVTTDVHANKNTTTVAGLTVDEEKIVLKQRSDNDHAMKQQEQEQQQHGSEEATLYSPDSKGDHQMENDYSVANSSLMHEMQADASDTLDTPYTDANNKPEEHQHDESQQHHQQLEEQKEIQQLREQQSSLDREIEEEESQSLHDQRSETEPHSLQSEQRTHIEVNQQSRAYEDTECSSKADHSVSADSQIQELDVTHDITRLNMFPSENSLPNNDGSFVESPLSTLPSGNDASITAALADGKLEESCEPNSGTTFSTNERTKETHDKDANSVDNHQPLLSTERPAAVSKASDDVDLDTYNSTHVNLDDNSKHLSAELLHDQELPSNIHHMADTASRIEVSETAISKASVDTMTPTATMTAAVEVNAPTKTSFVDDINTDIDAGDNDMFDFDTDSSLPLDSAENVNPTKPLPRISNDTIEESLQSHQVLYKDSPVNESFSSNGKSTLQNSLSVDHRSMTTSEPPHADNDHTSPSSVVKHSTAGEFIQSHDVEEEKPCVTEAHEVEQQQNDTVDHRIDAKSNTEEHDAEQQRNAQHQAEEAAVQREMQDARERKGLLEKQLKEEAELQKFAVGIPITKIPRSGSRTHATMLRLLSSNINDKQHFFLQWDSKNKKDYEAQVSLSGARVALNMTGGQLARKDWQRRFTDRKFGLSIESRERTLDFIVQRHADLEIVLNTLRRLPNSISAFTGDNLTTQ